MKTPYNDNSEEYQAHERNWIDGEAEEPPFRVKRYWLSGRHKKHFPSNPSVPACDWVLTTSDARFLHALRISA
jgi:hypothetical protein